jgi:putative acetyltransferase
MAGAMAIRAYDPSDLDAVIAIFRGAIREIASADYSPSQIEAWARVDRAAFAARRASRQTWVACVGGTPAGFADLEPDGHIDMLYVGPTHSRQGVARALLATITREADRLGLDSLVTEASVTARHFFTAQGFQVIAPERVSRNGETFLRYRMRKDLVRPRPAPDR